MMVLAGRLPAANEAAGTRRRRWTVVVAAALLVWAGVVGAQDRDPSPQPSPVLAVPLSDVPTRAGSAVQRLQGIENSLAARGAVKAIEGSLASVVDSIAEQEGETDRELAGQPTMRRLERLDTGWAGLESLLEQWASVLRVRSAALQESLDELRVIEATWQRTAASAQTGEAPRALLASIAEVQRAVGVTQRKVVDRRAEVLNAQEQIATAATRVAARRKEIDDARASFVGSLAMRDSPPVWRWFGRGEGVSESLVERVRDEAELQREGLWLFVQTQPVVWFHLAVILLTGLLLARAGKRAAKWGQEDSEAGFATRIFAVPYSAALLLGMLVVPWVYPRAPNLLRDLAGALALVPAIRILRGFLPPALHFPLYALGGFYFVDRLRSLIPVSVPLEGTLFLAELVGAIVLLSRLPPMIAAGRRAPPGRQQRAARVVRIALIAIFAVAFVATCFGFTRLGKLLGEGALACVYLSLVFYAAAQAAFGAWVYALHSSWLSSLSAAREYRWLLQRRGRRVIWIVAALTWLLLSLRFLGVFWSLGSALEWLLHAQIPLGQLSITPGDLVVLVLCVWGSFLLSRFLRFLLKEDVYPRFKLAQGVPYALSTLLHYGLVLIGFFVGVGAAGFDLSRISLIAGALSVGIGFGLQTLVNNFVSGLILLFERPVKVGDAIEVQGLSGVVRRIGIRSSTIRTWDGAELIVPNGLLIAETVTNWTLSDRARRIDIDVGVEYGTDPGRVLNLLQEVAAHSDDVMRTPAPVAMFQGFGDSSLNFRLRFWTGEFDRWLMVRSDLAVAVNDALAQAGIGIPFPQRDLHLRSVAAEGAGWPRPAPSHEEEE